VADTRHSTSEPLVTGEFALLLGTGVAYSLGMGALIALLPPFVVEVLGGNEATSGVVMGSMAITALLSRGFLGRAADRRGAQLLISVGAAVVALSLVLLVLTPTIFGALASRLVMGVGNAAFFIGTNMRAMELAPADRRSQAVALNLIAFHAGMGLGPLGGEWVLDRADYSTTWLVLTALTIAAAGLSLLLSRRPGNPDAEPSPLVHRGALLPGIVTLFGVFTFNGYLMFGALYADHVGLGNVGPVFLVSSGTMVITRFVFGRLPDVIGPIRAGSGALVVTVGAALVLAFWASPLGLFVGAALAALGLSMQSPSFMVIAIDGASARERGSAMATYTSFFDLANALNGPMIGAIVALSGYRAAFLAAGTTALIALAILQIVIAPRWQARTS
jgi:MFS family permease